MKVVTVKADADVLDILRSATVSGNKVQITAKLDRPMYMRVNKYMEAAGGKWSKADKAHVFPGDARKALALDAGEVVNKKQTYQEFFTPPEVVNRAIQLADIRPGMLVLEPSAGNGNLAVAAKHACPNVSVHAIEIQEPLVKELNKRDPSVVVLCADFLEYSKRVPQQYDRVIMNPPFTRGSDVKHVLAALPFVKNGGRLVAVMAAGILTASSKDAVKLREIVEERGSFAGLPDGSFAPETDVRTVLVCIDVKAKSFAGLWYIAMCSARTWGRGRSEEAAIAAMIEAGGSKRGKVVLMRVKEPKGPYALSYNGPWVDGMGNVGAYGKVEVYRQLSNGKEVPLEKPKAKGKTKRVKA